MLTCTCRRTARGHTCSASAKYGRSRSGDDTHRRANFDQRTDSDANQHADLDADDHTDAASGDHAHSLRRNLAARLL